MSFKERGCVSVCIGVRAERSMAEQKTKGREEYDEEVLGKRRRKTGKKKEKESSRHGIVLTHPII